ncbi:hypothetical protein V1264_021850 [Littorina saxatilis]|uniref:Uncharacterized protein n=1 Tax=Littorina saxatilis TaxID=31220 RepID=A0AAN9AJ82_9CAEN
MSMQTVCLNLKKAEMDSDLSSQQTTSPQTPLTQTVVSLLRPGEDVQVAVMNSFSQVKHTLNYKQDLAY